MTARARGRLSLLGAALAGACATARPAPPPPAPGASADGARAELRRAVDSMIADPEFANAHWGILVVNPASGDTLYSHNAGKLFMPASNQKILTGAVALSELGPDYRWRTTFAARGRVENGVLRGDLVVFGRGDPTVSDRFHGDAMHALRAVADSLLARGVRRVTGRVVAGGDAFPDSPYGFGWAWDDFTEPYSAGVDELLFNEGYAEVVVRGGAAGAPATVRVRPASTHPGSTRVATVAPAAAPNAVPNGARPRPRVTPDAAGAGYVVAGEVAAGDSAVLRVAHRDGNAAYLAALTEALAARGVAVGGGPAQPAAGRADTLFVLQSAPLRDALAAMEKPSQNQIAESFYKTLGLERTGVGSADSGRRVVERRLRAWGVEPDRDAAVRDGSGLSRHDYVTPRAVVRVLAAIQQDTAFRAFYDALPVAGVDGTIAGRMRGTPAEQNLRAKTGTVDKARSLSGYVTTADGELLVFSMLCNNFTVPNRAVERVQDAVGARLAAMRVRQPRPIGGVSPAEPRGAALVQSLERRFVTAVEEIDVNGVAISILRPRNSDDLITEENFVRDERLPYWADVWPSARVLAGRVLAEDGAGRALLELGCGSGLVATAAARSGFAVTVTDYEDDALRFTRANVWRAVGSEPSARLVDWRALPDDLGRFDVVVASDVLYEMAYAALIARALALTLARGGVAYIADPGRVAAPAFVDAAVGLGLQVSEPELHPIDVNGATQSIRIYRVRPR